MALVNEPALLGATADDRCGKQLINGWVINVDISFNHDKYMHIVKVKLWLNRTARHFWITGLNWFATREVSSLVSVFMKKFGFINNHAKQIFDFIPG